MRRTLDLVAAIAPTSSPSLGGCRVGRAMGFFILVEVRARPMGVAIGGLAGDIGRFVAAASAVSGGAAL